MLLARFRPDHVLPELLVDRAQTRARLRDRLALHLEVAEPADGVSVCVVGDKGVGKSILTHHVLEGLRATHGARALFVAVDCRRCRGRREVLARLAQGMVDELVTLESAGAVVPPQVMADARTLATLVHFDDVSLEDIHRHVDRFRHEAGGKLEAGFSLFGQSLRALFGLKLERAEEDSKALTGRVVFDTARLTRLAVELARQIREAGLRVVVYLDNIDELRHRYRSDATRVEVRLDTEGILELIEAPVALVLNMRTYYAGVLPREITSMVRLGPLEPDDLVDALARRLTHERAEVREAASAAEAEAAAKTLAVRATTPLAFLRWFAFLFEEGFLTPARLARGAEEYVRARYATLRPETLRRIVKAFPPGAAGQPIDRAALLRACGDNEAVLAQVQDRQVVLPVDFWNPTEFTLDPDLVLLHAMVVTAQAGDAATAPS